MHAYAYVYACECMSVFVALDRGDVGDVYVLCMYAYAYVYACECMSACMGLDRMNVASVCIPLRSSCDVCMYTPIHIHTRT